MRVLAAALSVLCFACGFPRPDTYIVPLADFEAAMELGPDDRILSEHNTVRLIAGHEPCLVLSPRDTRATLDVYPAKMDPGAPDAPNRECYGPALIWDSVPTTSGPSTFTITDGTATWSLVIWQPFEYRRFKIMSPQPAHPGETVTLHLPTNGTFDNTQVVVTVGTSTKLLDLTEGNGLTKTGTDVSFVLPATAPPTTATVDISFEHHVRIDRCDGPISCSGTDRSLTRLDLEIAP